MSELSAREALEFVETLLKNCKAESWFPDDDSKREGYEQALMEVIEYMRGVS